MDLLTSVRQTATLDRLQPAADRAVELIAVDIAAACTIAQVTATIRLGQTRRLVRDLPKTSDRSVRRGVTCRAGAGGPGRDAGVDPAGPRRARCAGRRSDRRDDRWGQPADRQTLIIKLDATACEGRRKAQARARRIGAAPGRTAGRSSARSGPPRAPGRPWPPWMC